MPRSEASVRVEQALQRSLTRVVGHAFGKVRHDDANAVRVIGLADLQVRRFARADLASALPSK